MAARRVRCACGGWPDCQLCHGARRYTYEPGPLGWLPFPCPTCGGTGKVDGRKCPTCRGAGKVDPADPPTVSLWDYLCKLFLGA
jgi:DnaJ-class molecular chaperone